MRAAKEGVRVSQLKKSRRVSLDEDDCKASGLRRSDTENHRIFF